MAPEVVYRAIEGYPAYRVGSDGTVWSCLQYNGHQARRIGDKWKTLVPMPDGDGYLSVGLFRHGKCARRKVHLLVLEAFVGPRPDGMEGCHGDGDVSNCWLENLRWDTKEANQADRLRHGTDCRGEKSPKAKLTEANARRIRERIAAGERSTEIAKDYSISVSTVRGIKAGRLWGWLDV